MLVLVKANAYGHGGVEFASMMQKMGADYLAVAYPVEGMELRKEGISLPVMVLTAGTDSNAEIIGYNLEPSIPSLYNLKSFVGDLKHRGITNYPVHVKIDSGMHRLGFCKDEIHELGVFLKNCPSVRVKSVFSHLAASEDSDFDEFTLAQVDSFKTMADELSQLLGYKPMYHILNSSGIERFPEYQFDMVRLGIGIYGYGSHDSDKLKPAASLKCKIIQIKRIEGTDETVGYGRKGKLSGRFTKTATIPVGYADGIDRRLGCGRACFSLNGKRVPTIGNICMDMCMLDVTDLDASEGDVVTIFGDDPDVMELASILETIPYEIMTGIPRRIKRVIIR